MKPYALLTLLFFFSQILCAAPINEEKKVAIKDLMIMVGSDKIGKQFANLFIQKMSQVLKKASPNIPGKAFTIIKEETMAIIDEEMLQKNTYYNLITPIYDKYLTLDEIQAVTAFYKSPVGQKMIKVLPDITRESMMAGQKWGANLGPMIQKRIKKRFEEEEVFTKKPIE